MIIIIFFGILYSKLKIKNVSYYHHHHHDDDGVIIYGDTDDVGTFVT